MLGAADGAARDRGHLEQADLSQALQVGPDRVVVQVELVGDVAHRHGMTSVANDLEAVESSVVTERLEK
jgi:hypothetical protein